MSTVKKQDLTPPFDGAVPPSRVGVYRTAYVSRLVPGAWNHGYSYWSGLAWGPQSDSIEEAELCGLFGGEAWKAPDTWLGLNFDPSIPDARAVNLMRHLLDNSSFGKLGVSPGQAAPSTVEGLSVTEIKPEEINLFSEGGEQ